MRVKNYGFALRLHTAGAVARYLTHIAAQDEEIPFYGQNRILRLEPVGDYWLGVVLTIRNQKSFFELKRSTNGIRISRASVGEDGLLEFNFFVVNPESGLGIYQHYYHSMGLTAFGALAKNRYKDFRRAMREQDPTQPIDHHLVFEPLFRKEDFYELLKEMQNIKSMNFRLAVLGNSDKLFEPLSGVANAFSHRATFSQGLSVTKIRKGIRDMINGGAHDVTVAAVDFDGLRHTLKASENLKDFGCGDFDQLFGGTLFNWDKLSKNRGAQELIDAIKDHAL